MSVPQSLKDDPRSNFSILEDIVDSWEGKLEVERKGDRFVVRAVFDSLKKVYVESDSDLEKACYRIIVWMPNPTNRTIITFDDK